MGFPVKDVLLINHHKLNIMKQLMSFIIFLSPFILLSQLHPGLEITLEADTASIVINQQNGAMSTGGFFEVRSEDGIAVIGISNNDGDGLGTGGQFVSNSDMGTGVHGRAHGTNAAGVFGESAGVQGTGVFGLVSGKFGSGVLGHSTGEEGVGVSGSAFGTDGSAIFGLATGRDGKGVHGIASGIEGRAIVGEAIFDQGLGLTYGG